MLYKQLFKTVVPTSVCLRKQLETINRLHQKHVKCVYATYLKRKCYSQYGAEFPTFPQHPGAHPLGCTMFMFIRQPSIPLERPCSGESMVGSKCFFLARNILISGKHVFLSFFAFVWEVHFPWDNSDLGFLTSDLESPRYNAEGNLVILFSRNWSYGRKTGSSRPICPFDRDTHPNNSVPPCGGI